jgi:hypothetical protein
MLSLDDIANYPLDKIQKETEGREDIIRKAITVAKYSLTAETEIFDIDNRDTFITQSLKQCLNDMKITISALYKGGYDIELFKKYKIRLMHTFNINMHSYIAWKKYFGFSDELIIDCNDNAIIINDFNRMTVNGVSTPISKNDPLRDASRIILQLKPLDLKEVHSSVKSYTINNILTNIKNSTPIMSGYMFESFMNLYDNLFSFRISYAGSDDGSLEKCETNYN